MWASKMLRSSFLLLAGGTLLSCQRNCCCDAALACESDKECEDSLLVGSKCQDGFCTNPFHRNGGCLKSMLPEWSKVRTCGSDDPPEAAELGYCRPSPFDYMEVRVASQNWDSSFLNAWIMQIILSEILDVPTSIEGFAYDIQMNFYNEIPTFQYGLGSAEFFEDMELGVEVGDCRLVKAKSPDDEYRPCLHLSPDIWLHDVHKRTRSFETQGILEAPMDLGMMAVEHWFVPRFTAEEHPSVVSYLGLSGEENRKKLASIFKRPTTWTQYCSEVSPDNCASADGVASRSPADDEEGNHYFVEGLFTGYFRATEENNCTAFPRKCTGHIVDYPCYWSSFVKQQAYHLDISLESSGSSGVVGGYDLGHMFEVWQAANKTRSHVMMVSWSDVNPVYEQFLGTQSEFTPVVLPRPTKICQDNRISSGDVSCGDTYDLKAQTGNPEGACDYFSYPVVKLLGGGLRELTQGNSIPTALRSPAVDAISRYKISNLEMGEIFGLWRELATDPYGVDPRQAACQWIVDNFDAVQSFIPGSFPRRIVSDETIDSALFQAALAISGASILVIAMFAGLVYMRRRKKVFYHAQVGFVFVVLAGLAMVSVGGLLLAVPPSDATCTLVVWLVNLGYAIELSPLALRVDAINRLASSGKRMQRVRLSSRATLGSSSVACVVIGAFLIAWTIVDAPSEDVSYKLTDDTNGIGETIVTATHHCASNSIVWAIFGVVWQAALLLYALVLVFMANRVRDDINDTRNLAMLVFSQFVFVALRVASVALEGTMNSTVVSGITSIFLSLDCLFAALIFVLPKLCERSDDQEDEILPDLFPRSTILIADIAGFTAWSSVRDPTQVFKFLDTVYSAFDELAEKRKVFKVETVRDSYVAATGVPREQKDHALVMAKFACDISIKMRRLSNELEILYGPDTSKLSLKIGIHSGPTTGGMLKGKSSRFQLFGDTVTLAVNIERAGLPGRIHLSERTANLLMEAGKSNWLEARSPPVYIKGKGEIKTWWLDRFASLHDADQSQRISVLDSEEGTEQALWDIVHGTETTAKVDRQRRRLIDWNVGVLHDLLKQIIARRYAGSSKNENELPGSGGIRASDTMSESRASPLQGSVHSAQFDTQSVISTDNVSTLNGGGSMPLHEVVEIINLPKFDGRRLRDSDRIEISESTLEQLKFLVETIEEMYNDNPFHSFSHASHVVQAVQKYMKRIMAASGLNLGVDVDRKSKKAAAALHDHTYGITSDPLTRFACVFSALIHDLDHPGVPNPQLIKENPVLAASYNDRSVAEQNSFDLAWGLIMDQRFKELRQTICPTKVELLRFRQLVVNSVMATDLGDKELKELRNSRWDKAFKAQEGDVEQSKRDPINRKATIVIEHLIQAADVSHTMQHWHVYREWNEKLFREMYYAYKSGRADKNPADFWYKGELGFFDFYIIPLSKKLADCGVFGVTSDENLNYANNNRAEWLAKGKEVVAEMMEKMRQEEMAAARDKPSASKAETLPSSNNSDQAQRDLKSIDETATLETVMV